MEVSNGRNIYYEISLLQITQLCGTDFTKKNFILTSINKYFSSAKYAQYEENYQDNIRIDGEKVGRKYFLSQRISSREDLINMMKITKSSVMMKYLTSCMTEFTCQKELDCIAQHLDKLYLEINDILRKHVDTVEISYEQRNLMDIIQSSKVFGKENVAIEQLSNYELLETYFDLLKQVQMRSPEKIMIIIENIDHLVGYDEYLLLFDKMHALVNEFTIWFVITTSIEGFVVMKREFMSGINIINDIIFVLPEIEKLYYFMKERYPCEKEIDFQIIEECIKIVIQKIGQSGYVVNMESAVMLKLINDSLCINGISDITLNQLESCFLNGKNML